MQKIISRTEGHVLTRILAFEFCSRTGEVLYALNATMVFVLLEHQDPHRKARFLAETGRDTVFTPASTDGHQSTKTGHTQGNRT